MIDALLAISLLLSSVAINFAHVKCTLATTQGRRFAAANWGMIVYALGMLGWAIALTRGWWLLSFEVIGLWLGTVIGVK